MKGKKKLILLIPVVVIAGVLAYRYKTSSNTKDKAYEYWTRTTS